MSNCVCDVDVTTMCDTQFTTVITGPLLVYANSIKPNVPFEVYTLKQIITAEYIKPTVVFINHEVIRYISGGTYVHVFEGTQFKLDLVSGGLFSYVYTDETDYFDSGQFDKQYCNTYDAGSF